MVDIEFIRKKHYVEGWSIRKISRNLKTTITAKNRLPQIDHVLFESPVVILASLLQESIKMFPQCYGVPEPGGLQDSSV